MGSAKDKRTALLPFSPKLTVRIMAVIAFRWFEMSIRSICFLLDDASPPQWGLMPLSRSTGNTHLVQGSSLVRFSFPRNVSSDHPRASACMLRTSELLRVTGASQLYGMTARVCEGSR